MRHSTVLDERCSEKMEKMMTYRGVTGENKEDTKEVIKVVDMVLENSKMNYIKKIKIRFNKKRGFFENFLKKI